jgi:two-component system phosphate regulon sensor histidine kinase PhoR
VLEPETSLRFGIRAKLFLISLGLIVVSVIIGYAYSSRELERRMTDEIESELRVRARLVADRARNTTVPFDDQARWSQIASELAEHSDSRVTLIQKDGRVIADSDVSDAQLASVENHHDRPEVRAALQGQPGRDVRSSATVGRRMLYVAEPVVLDGNVIGAARVAMPLARLDAAVASLGRLTGIAALLAIAAAIVLSTIAAEVASRTARSLTATARRMAAGDLSTHEGEHGQDEFGELGRALDRLARDLSTTLDTLRSERDRMSGILSGMPEGVLLLDDKGRVALVNPALREMMLLPSGARGKSPLEVIRHAELKELLDEAIETHEPASREIEIGGIKPRRLLVRASPLEGDTPGVLAVFMDVTEMRRLETMRRDFVANVSHELRTPVTAIRSAAETLELALEQDPDAAKRFVDIIDRNAERLRGLVEDLLDLSRIESREFKLAMEPLNLNQVVSHVLGLFRERAEKKGIRMHEDVPSDLGPARADRRALEHVLTNLVDNAVKYCARGADVRVTARCEDRLLRVVVADTGPGVEERHLPRLFERFYRVDAGRSRELGGTGLGLSIVKHLVEAMGGRVSVESTLGKGTSFSFTLAMSDAKQPAASNPKNDARLLN